MKTRIFALAILAVATIFVIAQSLPISRFPNTPTPLDSDLFVLAQTQAPSTNKNIRYDQLRGAIRSGLATEAYVNSVSNSIVSGSQDHLWTNNGAFLQPTTNGDARIIGNLSLTSTGRLGGLVVTQDVRLLGHNSTSNFVWTCTNSTTGEGEWRTTGGAGFAALEVQTNTVRLGLVTNLNWTYGITGSVSGATAILGIDDSLSLSNLSNSIFGQITTASNTFAFNRTNQWTTNISDTPVNGRVWFQGFPSQAFVTNNARNRTWEWNPTNQSMIMGSVGNLGVVNHTYIATSNFFDFPNVGYMSTIRGTSCLANADYAFVNGDRSTIYTNAHNSFIAAGSASQIRTNASNSFIGSGVNCVIHVNSGGSFIGSGQDSSIEGGSPWCTIAGGFFNLITGGGNSYATISGGLNNTIGTAAGRSEKATIGGGELNVVRGDHGTIGGGRANNMQGVSDFSTIAGGNANAVGSAGNGATRVFIGGGESNLSDNDTEYSVITGGRSGTISGGSSNAFMGGGFNNTINANNKFSQIVGGERHTINGVYSFVLGGASNSVSADRAGAIGISVTNRTAGSVTVGELISYNTPSVIAGAGTGSTNYTLQVTSPKMLLGSSNVNIVAVMQTISGKTHNWSVNITNLSADTWGFSFSASTNRVKWQSYMYGTNAPVVLTNNTLLRLTGESEGTNTLVTYEYFTPAL